MKVLVCHNILCIRTAKALTRLCRCTGLSEHSLLADARLKSQIMVLKYLHSKLKDITLFQWKVAYYKATSDRGPTSLHFPEYYIFMKALLWVVRHVGLYMCRSDSTRRGARPWFSLSANITYLKNRDISKHYRDWPDATCRNTWSGSAMVMDLNNTTSNSRVSSVTIGHYEQYCPVALSTNKNNWRFVFLLFKD